MDIEDEAVGAREVPRVALSLPEAAAVLGVSLQSFRDEIFTDLMVVRAGRRVLGGVRQLEQWVGDGRVRSGLATGGHDAR